MFHTSYVEARRAFRDVGRESGFELATYELPGYQGIDGESLTIDVATKGSGNQLILTSGVHGVEGYTGSACQLDCMRRWDADGIRKVLIHAVNPYGFSYKSRTNECNVDLNRNCGQDFPQDHNFDYGAVHAQLEELLLAPSLPDPVEIRHRLETLQKKLGSTVFAAIVAAGQYRYPNGLFYGGNKAQESWKLLNDIVAAHCSNIAKQTLTIDIHTGLGPPGHGELIYMGDHQDIAFTIAQQWLHGVTCPASGNSASQAVAGSAENFFLRDDLGELVSHVALEFGTAPLLDVLTALCCDAWLRNQRDPGRDESESVQNIVFDAFCGHTADWQEAVLTGARHVVAEAVTALKLA